MIFFSFIGLDAVSTAGDEVKDPQKTMPRAIIAALIVVTSFYILVAFAGLGTQDAAEFGSDEQSEAGLSVILENITGGTWASTAAGRGRRDLHLLGDPGRDVRPDTNPVRNGTRRAAAVDVRKGQPAQHDSRRQHDHRGCRHVILAGFIPLNWLLDAVSIGTLVAFITVSVGVIILRVREPDLPRPFKVPGYPVTPVLSVLACMAVLYGLRWQTWLVFGACVAAVLVFYLLWGRRHSALNDGGDGYIPTAVPGRRRCSLKSLTTRHQHRTRRDRRRRLSRRKERAVALHLAVEAAQTLTRRSPSPPLYRKPWTTPSPARIDAEYATWADQLGADSPA